VIALGPYLPEAAAAKILELRRENLIAQDAFVTDGATFGAQFWPEGATPAPEPEAAAEPAAEPTPAVEPDETPKQARTSEAALSRDERKALQESLKWYGFYASAIDGAFGPGTRKSMAAWQQANGLEPTGILTSRQRATLITNHAADLAEFGFASVTEPEAGIEITLPLSLVAFDHYEPPFVHYDEKDGSGLRIMLISEPGGAEALAGLYDILQTLEVVPATGERAKTKTDFTINAASATVQSYAYAETRDGMVKGYLVIWKPADAERMVRILPALQSSFRAVGDKALDPGLVPMEDAARTGLLSGLEVRRARLSRSGFYVDAVGHVLTTVEAVDGCARITLDHDTEADVAQADTGSGMVLLAPRAAMSPAHFANLAQASPRPGSEITVAGYSYEDRLPAPVLTFGSYDEAGGLNGEAGISRLSAPVLVGDAGGPVLDSTGAVIGMLLAKPPGDKVLPQGVAFAVDAATISAALGLSGVVPTTSNQTAPATPDALNAAALGMTVLVSCWD
jgi:peptidoglycan hydrolase-like protein with peptidoglycan-binding domain